ncbi:potassium channel family protein [Caballeronia sp. INML2]|uniref:potassium channel family protein n=1 Tax=Caballeronia sp. INML2 TaxID=2921748 RepID=UPI00202897F6|nr:potassium channel family protein [Caballeronia sp. INML2]
MNFRLSEMDVRGVMRGMATIFLPLAAGYYLVHLSYSILSPRSDAIVDGVTMFALATLLVVTARRMFLVVQLTALGILLCIAVWTYSDIYMKLGILDVSSTVVHDRESCLYFSIITFTTLGYGDYRPTLDGRMVAATEALTGYVFFGVFISMISSYVAINRQEYRRRK